MRPAVSCRKTKLQFSATRLLACPFQRALAQKIQLELAHRPFQSQQKTIIDQLWVVHSIWINDQGIRQSAQLDQMVPVAPIASQTRSLNAENGSNMAGANHRYNPLKPRTLD